MEKKKGGSLCTSCGLTTTTPCPFCNPTRLHIRGNTWEDINLSNITTLSIPDLCPLLADRTNLSSLSLQGCNLVDDEIEALAKTLSVAEAVRMVRLDRNPIGNKGARALAHMLEKNVCIELLSLQQTRISIWPVEGQLSHRFSAVDLSHCPMRSPPAYLWNEEVRPLGRSPCEEKKTGLSAYLQDLATRKPATPSFSYCLVRGPKRAGKTELAATLQTGKTGTFPPREWSSKRLQAFLVGRGVPEPHAVALCETAGIDGSHLSSGVGELCVTDKDLASIGIDRAEDRCRLLDELRSLIQPGFRQRVADAWPATCAVSVNWAVKVYLDQLDLPTLPMLVVGAIPAIRPNGQLTVSSSALASFPPLSVVLTHVDTCYARHDKIPDFATMKLGNDTLSRDIMNYTPTAIGTVRWTLDMGRPKDAVIPARYEEASRKLYECFPDPGEHPLAEVEKAIRSSDCVDDAEWLRTTCYLQATHQLWLEKDNTVVVLPVAYLWAHSRKLTHGHSSLIDVPSPTLARFLVHTGVCAEVASTPHLLCPIPRRGSAWTAWTDSFAFLTVATICAASGWRIAWRNFSLMAIVNRLFRLLLPTSMERFYDGAIFRFPNGYLLVSRAPARGVAVFGAGQVPMKTALAWLVQRARCKAESLCHVCIREARYPCTPRVPGVCIISQEKIRSEELRPKPDRQPVTWDSGPRIRNLQTKIPSATLAELGTLAYVGGSAWFTLYTGQVKGKTVRVKCPLSEENGYIMQCFLHEAETSLATKGVAGAPRFISMVSSLEPPAIRALIQECKDDDDMVPLRDRLPLPTTQALVCAEEMAHLWARATADYPRFCSCNLRPERFLIDRDTGHIRLHDLAVAPLCLHGGNRHESLCVPFSLYREHNDGTLAPFYNSCTTKMALFAFGCLFNELFTASGAHPCHQPHFEPLSVHSFVSRLSRQCLEPTTDFASIHRQIVTFRKAFK